MYKLLIILLYVSHQEYCIYPSYSQRQAWTNSVDPYKTAQNVHCLLFRYIRFRRTTKNI